MVICCTAHYSYILWHAVVKHWYLSPNQLCNPSHYVDASVKHRYASGDPLVFPFKDGERKWKFDVYNEVGFNFGDDYMTKDAAFIYLPFHH